MLDFENAELFGNTALALGNFDGIHLGHLGVLKATLEEARRSGLVAAVLIFDKHPKSVLSNKRPPRLMTDEARVQYLEKMGFCVIEMSFSAYRNMMPEEFIAKIYCKLNVRAIFCGFNYRYGKGACATARTLEESCKRFGISFGCIEEASYENEAISSTRIRHEIEKGNIKKANAMLGRCFSYKIEVVSGDQRGRVLGFPTINQFFPEDFVTARYGVYASKVKIGTVWYPSVTNIGIRPTINTETLRSETCIIGFNGDLYGLEVEVFLLDFIRDEKKFKNLEELCEAISSDAQTARKIYEEYISV